MKRVIVDINKVNNTVLNLLMERFPNGYRSYDILRFKNAKNETLEAIEIKTDDTIYLIKIGKKLNKVIEEYQEEYQDDFECVDEEKEFENSDYD
jgi:hypothetical protein